MRVEGFVLSALVIAASAVIFGDLGRAAAPDQAQMGDAEDAAYAPQAPAAVTFTTGCPAAGATALRFLDQGAYGSEATPGCGLR
ncbi:hypothetical protein [Roseixanthobacter pseudopolyaromaticivorans]|uniref:hypothetical protein n=1 Tax=Xanthobacteraceae TaxID=335928 RepID=UPI00372AA1BA